MAAHAKNYPPSAAKRWLPCPFSAAVALLYDNDETDASLKGDLWHRLMEDLIRFGVLGTDADPDAAEALQDLYDYVVKRFKEGGPGTKLYIEQRLDIKETGEFGTGDIIIVAPLFLEIIDEKSGYIVVEPTSEQNLTYLCGAIDMFGTRPEYYSSIHQPNFDHIKGPLRTVPVSDLDVKKHRERMAWAVANPDHCEAGSHCKASYCDHRGACEAFRVYAQDDLSLGWHASELKAMTDENLARALDASDELAGYRTELRAEAMRRIMNMDRTVPGYKAVKGRRNRQVRDAFKLVDSVHGQLGYEWAAKLFPDLAWAANDLCGLLTGNTGLLDESLLKHLGTAKHIEDVLKQYARVHNLPRGGWKMLYDNVVGAYIVEQASGLTLERAIDGRPAHKRGGEFGVLQDPAKVNTLPIIL